MQQSQSSRHHTAYAPVLVIALALSACSGQQASKGGVLGYGTPGVSGYVGEDQATSLQAQLERCGQVPQDGVASQTQGLAAACGQLQRTLRNQPGNSARSADTRREGGGPARQ